MLRAGPVSYPEFIPLSGGWVKPRLALQNFSIYDGDPLFPPDEEAAQEVHSLDPRLK